MFAEESEELYLFCGARVSLVGGSENMAVCGGRCAGSHALCVDCYDRYCATRGRRTQSELHRKRDDSSEAVGQKSVAFARLLALAPDLLGRSEPLLEQGSVDLLSK